MKHETLKCSILTPMQTLSTKKPNILIVDDDIGVRHLLCALLEQKNICTQVDSAEMGLAEIEKQHFDVVISDVNMGGMSGIELTSKVIDISPDTVVMMISGTQTSDTPIEALRSGAFDYIRKPFDVDQVEIAVDRALKHSALLAAKRAHETELESMVAERTSKLDYLAYNDPLTGLRNRVFFEKTLAEELATKTDRSGLAVLFISLDRFKDLRNTLGHSAGDLLIIEVAKRLSSVASHQATVARFDGDEFAVLLTGTDNNSVSEYVTRVFEAFTTPISTGDDEITGSISVGVSVSLDSGHDVSGMLREAGAALSFIRSRGGNSCKFFTSDLSDTARMRLDLESDLRKALEKDEFELYYQPKVDMTSKQIVGMEALLRWKRDGAVMVSPSEFIPVAEATGIIVPLGEWVLRTACLQTKIWHDMGFSLTVAVNLSPRQFQQDDLAAKVIDIVDQSNIEPQLLNLEITESSVMNNPDSAIQILRKLRDEGIKISIDDFGTGYSSLGVLKNLPIDVLKIDKSFVDEVNLNPDDAALVTAIVTLAHDLRLAVVAEGVETPEQLNFLRLLRCDEWQGYLFSRPLPTDAFEELIIRNSAAHGAMSDEPNVLG